MSGTRSSDVAARGDARRAAATGLLLLFAIGAGVRPAAADAVVTIAGQTAGGRVEGLSAAGVALDGGRSVPWREVASVRIDRPALRCPGQRLLLRDGTELGGVVWRIGSDGLTFRSTTAGELEVGWGEISALIFAEGAVERPAGPEGTNGICVVMRDGSVRRGAIVTGTARQLLMRTADGLEKVDTASVALVVAAPAPAAALPALVLRNGDRLAGPLAWRDGGAAVRVAGHGLEIGMDAVREIRLAGSAGKGKE